MDFVSDRSVPIAPPRKVELSFDHLNQKVQAAAKGKIRNESELARFLKSWWCTHYNRPSKDPLLLSYTLEELVVEYLDVIYRADPEAFKKVKAEESSKKEDDDWVEKMADETGAKLLSPEEQRKHERDIEDALSKHAEDNEIDDMISMGSHTKFDIPE